MNIYEIEIERGERKRGISIYKYIQIHIYIERYIYISRDKDRYKDR